MCEVGKNRLHSTVHHYCRVDSYSSKSGKLCWCYNGRSLTQNSLRYKLSKARNERLLMQVVDVSYV